jgi:uncharacterized protein (TIGR04255 family)
MRFPDSERVHYKQNPLVEVICQLRFKRLLKIESEVPAAFQDRIRKAYPEIRETTTISPPLPPQVAQLVGLEPGAIGQRAFDFLTADSTWKVSLTSHFVALTATEYRKWEDFQSRLAPVVHAFCDVYDVGTFTRIGLRYRDLIQRSRLKLEGRRWAELLNKDLVGELRDPTFESAAKHAARELVLDLDFDEAAVRLYHGFAQLQGNEENCYVIDSDFFRERETERADVKAVLDRFNREAGRLFRWSIADPLHQSMEPEAVG